MTEINAYLEKNAAKFEEDLKVLLRIPSVSTDESHKQDMLLCAQEVVRQLNEAGIAKAEVMPTPGHPIVYAESEFKPDRPTVLVYGHYDVQPEDPVEEWETPPFEPTIRDGKIYGRGTSDDKGQFIIHVKAAKTLNDLHMLPVNLKFCLEGEEECGSPSLEQWIIDHADLLKADVLVISDTTMYAPGKPSLLYGLRGLSYVEVEVKGGDGDMHSGMFGGAVPNPINELCRIIAALKDDKGHITIPGFYDKVRPLQDSERQEWAQLDFDEEDFRQNVVGAKALCGEEGFTCIERRWARPTLDVNGIWGGFTGEGAKTVIPARAYAKISCRLVPDQDDREIADLLEKEIKRLADPSVEVKVTFHHGGSAWMTSPDAPVMQAASRAAQKAWNATPARVREGGSIPIVATFTSVLQIPAILMGIGLEDEQIHAPNEHLSLENFHAGIKASIYLMQELAELPEFKR
ncbi:dipeptidase [bacterium]|nr:dipeptidase [bacterium]